MSLSTTPRCLICRMHLDLCVCEFLPHFELKTRITILMHAREFHLVSNTAFIVPRILSNSQVLLRGHVDPQKSPPISENLNSEYNHVVLFPHAQAKELNAEFLEEQDKPLNLIVPDGNWRQAAKMIKRESMLNDLPKVILPSGPISRYRLRRYQKPEGVCTFEAIARALGVIENSTVQKDLENFFERRINRILWTRGKISRNEFS